MQDSDVFFLTNGNRTLTGIDEMKCPAELQIPYGVTKIDKRALADCPAKKIIMPDTVTEIGYEAFSGCDALEYVRFSKNLKTIGQAAFRSCFSLSKIEIGSTCPNYSENLFECCYSLTEIPFREGMTEIQRSAFSECSSIESLDFSEGITVIRSGAAAYCQKLQSVTIPSTLRIIEDDAFRNCANISQIRIKGENPAFFVEEFSGCLFARRDDGYFTLIKVPCTATEIRIPKTVTHSHSEAFCGCDNLKKVYIDCDFIDHPLFVAFRTEIVNAQFIDETKVDNSASGDKAEAVAEESVVEAEAEAEAEEQPAIEEEVAVTDEPVVETEAVVEEAVVEEPVIEDSLEETAVEEPVIEEEVAVADEPVVEEPVIEEEVAVAEEEPVIEDSLEEVAVADEPVVETEAVTEESVVEEPVVEAEAEAEAEEQPAIEEEVAVTDEPVVETEAVADEPVVEEPVIEEEVAVTEEPVVEAEETIIEVPAPEIEEPVIFEDEQIEEDPVVFEEALAEEPDEPVLDDFVFDEDDSHNIVRDDSGNSLQATDSGQNLEDSGQTPDVENLAADILADVMSESRQEEEQFEENEEEELKGILITPEEFDEAVARGIQEEEEKKDWKVPEGFFPQNSAAEDSQPEYIPPQEPRFVNGLKSVSAAYEIIDERALYPDRCESELCAAAPNEMEGITTLIVVTEAVTENNEISAALKEFCVELAKKHNLLRVYFFGAVSLDNDELVYGFGNFALYRNVVYAARVSDYESLSAEQKSFAEAAEIPSSDQPFLNVSGGTSLELEMPFKIFVQDSKAEQTASAAPVQQAEEPVEKTPLEGRGLLQKAKFVLKAKN